MSFRYAVRAVQCVTSSKYAINRCKYLTSFVPTRLKNTQYKGVKGIRARKCTHESHNELIEDESAYDSNAALFLDDRAYDEVASGAMNVTRHITAPQNVLIIQPYVKWGPKHNVEVQPTDQLAEAEALIRSLPNWEVALALKVPLESLERKTVFGSGKIEELRTLVHELRQRNNGNQLPLTCLFISKGTLSFAQKRFLEAEFNLPVMDRYSVVIQILRLHATSAESRLQVALAELPYIWAQAKDANLTQSRVQGYSLTDTQREILRTRERKLKTEMERIRNQRKLLRNKRKQKNYPIVAVVGYTNCGKTSLIKALTVEESMQPRNQLFATLDVTAHGGLLPCNLQVIYMDTVGFMSDLPTGLIECFVATLEDAMLADVIVHVQDIAHPCHQAQKQHVESTLRTLAQNVSKNDSILPPIINVGNKVDLLKQPFTNLANSNEIHLISAKQKTGLDELLLTIEKQLLLTTGRRKITMRVRNGGNEMSWLYKNAAVVEMHADEKNAEMMLINVVIMDSVLQQFKREFCQ